MAPGVAAAAAGVERCGAADGREEWSAGAKDCRQWYTLCVVKAREPPCDDAEGTYEPASEEDAETLAGLLTPQQALAARSPALSVEEPDSPEQSGSTSRPAVATKPGGPCDHCGTSGACERRPTSTQALRSLRHPPRRRPHPQPPGRAVPRC